MKILIVSHEFPPRLGGAGIVASGMDKYLSSKYFVDTIYTDRICKSKFFHKLWPLIYPLYFMFFDFKKYDLIILNDPAVQYGAGLILSKQKLNKCISIIHGPEKYIKADAPKLLKVIGFKRFFFKAINSSKKKVYVSNFLKNQCENETNLYYKQNALVVHNGLEDTLVDIKKELEFKSRRKESTMLTVCRIEKEKGLDNALFLFIDMLKIDSEMTWTIVGQGSYIAELQELASKNGVLEKITFKGALDRKSVIKEMVTHEYFIHLPNWNEPFGLTLLEASFCKCKIVTNNKGGIPEVLDYISENGMSYVLEDNSDISNIMKIKFNGNDFYIRKQSDFCVELINEACN